MNKPFKILAIALGGIALILGLGATYLSFIFDPNQFKSQLIELVKNKKHRNLSIDGNIQLYFFPKLGVSLEKIKLSEFESTTQFAALDKAQVSLALMPLLQKQIVIDRVSVLGMHLRYQRDLEGKSNIDDLIKHDPSEKETAPSPMSSKKMRFDIEGIDITQSNFDIDDKKAELKGSINDLNLSTGKVGDQIMTPIKFSANLHFDKPQAEAKLDLNTLLRFDIAQKSLELKDFKTQINGKLGANPIELRFETTALNLNQQQSKSEQIKLSAKLGDTKAISANIILNRITLSEKTLSIAELTLQGQTSQAGVSKEIDLTSKLNLTLETRVIELPQLTMQLKLNDQKLAQTSILVPITGQLKLDLKDKKLDTTLDAKFDDTTLHTSVQVQNFSTPEIKFKVNIDNLNLDRYIKSSTGQTQTEASYEEDLNLSALKSFNLDGVVHIGALQVKNLHIKEVQLPVKAVQGEFAMNGITAQLYQGTVAGNIGFTVESNRLEMQQTLSDVQINPLLLDFMKKDIVEGRGNLSIDIKTHGKRASQFKDNLDGSIRAQLFDGAVKGINLAKSLRELKAKILNKTDQQQAANQLEKTDFSALSFSINFFDGIGNSDDLDMKSPFLRVGGKGQVNLRNSSLDYTARATIVNTSAGQDGADLAQLKDLTIPIKISGPFDKIGYQLQFKQIGSEALKSALKAKADPIIEEKKKELKEKVNEKLKESLKGLFER